MNSTLVLTGDAVDLSCSNGLANVYWMDLTSGYSLDSINFGWSNCLNGDDAYFFAQEFDKRESEMLALGMLDNTPASSAPYGVMRLRDQDSDTLGVFLPSIDYVGTYKNNRYVLLNSSRTLLLDSFFNVINFDTLLNNQFDQFAFDSASGTIVNVHQGYTSNLSPVTIIAFYDSLLNRQSLDSIDLFPIAQDIPRYAVLSDSGSAVNVLSRRNSDNFGIFKVSNSGQLISSFVSAHSEIDSWAVDSGSTSLYAAGCDGWPLGNVHLYRYNTSLGSVTDSIVLDSSSRWGARICYSRDGYIYAVLKLPDPGVLKFKVYQMYSDLNVVSTFTIVDSSVIYSSLGKVTANESGIVVFNVFNNNGYDSKVYAIQMSPTSVPEALPPVDLDILTEGNGFFSIGNAATSAMRSLTVYDVQGRTVLQQQQQNRFQLTAPGMYVVEVVMEDGRVWRQKLINP